MKGSSAGAWIPVACHRSRLVRDGSVKWLQRIVVSDRPFNGYYQTFDYAFWRKGELTPLSDMQVKAQTARRATGETVSNPNAFKGRTQPIERDPNRGTYMINHLLPINVEVQ